MPAEDYHIRIYETLLAMYRLLDERLPPAGKAPDGAHTGQLPDPDTGPATDQEELMTIREAYMELNVSRGTIFMLRKQGKLTSLYQQKNVRLLRTEIEEAKRWYSQMKGKI